MDYRKEKRAFISIIATIIALGGSTALIIKTTNDNVETYNINEVTLTNVISNSENSKTITNNASKTLTYTAEDGYVLPEEIDVTGASSNWEANEGKLTLSKATSDVNISIVALHQYTITPNLVNVLADVDNQITIIEGKTATLKFTASEGYSLPSQIVVNGASYTWNESNGKLTISNPTSNISFTITGNKLPPEKINYDMSNVKWDYVSPFTYDGEVKEVKVINLPEGVTVDSYSMNKATNAGSYTASVTFNYDSVHYNRPVIEDLTWTINKANYDMSNAKWDYVSPFTYDGETKEVVVTGLPSGVVATYTNNSKTDAGNYTASVSLAYDTTNYNKPTISDLSWSINKATATINTSNLVTNFVYDGNVHKIESGATLNHNETNLVYTNNEFTNVGTGSYTITISASETTNYNAISTDVTISVAKATSSIDTTNVVTSYTYTGLAQSISGASLNNNEQTLTYINNSFTNAGDYTVNITVSESDNYNAISTSINVVVNKADQTKPVSPTLSTKTSNSIEVNAISEGKGNTKYGISTTNTTPTSWQDTTSFTGLTSNTTYYLFTKYEGNSNYNEVISLASEIKTYNVYSINNHLTDCKSDSHNATTIEENSTVTLVYTPALIYIDFYDTVTVTGATLDSWDASTGTLVISNPTSNVDVTITTFYRVYKVTIGIAPHGKIVDIYDETCTIKATILPENALNKAVTWASSDETVATIDANGLVTFHSVGNTTITVTTVDGGYTSSGLLKIQVLTPTVIAPTPKVLTYTGEAQELITAGSVDVGTLKYKLGADGTYSTNIPTATEAGTYTIYYKSFAPAKSSVHDSEESSFTVTINKATYNLSGFSWNYTSAYTYDKTEKEVTVSGLPTGVTVTSYSNNKKTNAGNYTATVDISYDENNYLEPLLPALMWTINKADPSIDTSGVIADFVYDGNPHTINSGATLNHNEAELVYSNNVITNVGTGIHEVVITAPETTNYKGMVANVYVVVSKATATIDTTNVNTNFTYTGSAQSISGATISNDEQTLTYTNNSFTDAGNYTVTISAAESSNYNAISTTVNVVVAKANYDMSSASWNHSSPYTYDGVEKEVIVTGLPTGVTVASYSNNAATNAGSYTSSVSFNYDSNNYNLPTIANLNWTINKATDSINTSSVTKAFTYTGNALSISGASITNTEQSLTYTNNSFTDVGNYTVTISAAESTNYNAISTTVNVVVGKATYDMSSASWNYTSAYTYDGNEKKVTVSGLPTGVSVASYSNNKATNAGSYTASVTFNYDSDNYNQPVLANLPWAINKATATIDTTGVETNYVYDGNPHTINSGATLNHSETSLVYTNNVFTEVGTGSYTITISAVETTNYNAISTDVTISVNKATASINTSSVNTNFTYTGEAQSISGATLNNDEQTLTYTNNSFTNVGSYTVTISAEASANYNAISTNVNVTVNKANATVTSPTANNVTYDGNDHSLLNAGTTSGGKWQYKLSDGTYGDSIPSKQEAGTYTVYFKLVGGDNYNDIAESSLDVTISKATYNMSGASWSHFSPYTYDGNEKEVTVTGLPSGVTVASYSNNKATNAGSYTASVTFNYDSDNYNEPTIANLNWTINKATPELTAPTAKTLTYTGSSLELVNIGSTSGGTLQYKLDSGTYSTDIPSATNAGTYTVYYKVVGNSNYNDIAEASVEVSIAKAAQSITNISDLSKTYDGTAVGIPTFNVLCSVFSESRFKLSTDDDSTYSSTSPTNAGTYIVKIETSETANYLAGSATATFTISKATYNMSGASWSHSSPYTYDGNEKEVTVTGLPSGVTVKSYSNNKATNAGSYTASVSFNYDSTNYNQPNLDNLSWVINKATPVVTAPTAKTLTYTGYEQELVNAGSTTGGTLQYKLGTTGTYSDTIPSAINAGTYTVYYKVVGNDIYKDIDEASVEVTINKMDIDAPDAPRLNSKTSTSVVLKVIEPAPFDSLFGINTTNEAPTSWQESLTFTNLTPNTTYYFFVKHLGEGLNFNDSLPSSSLAVTTNKATPVVTAPTAKTLAYTGSFQELVNAGSTTGGTLQYKLDSGIYSTAIPSAKYIGTYTVYYKVVGNDTYYGIDEASVEVTISKATYDMSGASWSHSSPYTYDGNEKEVTVTGLPSGVTVKSYSSNKATDAGSYTASVLFNYDSTNYNTPTLENLSWVINKAAQSITNISDVSKVYDGEEVNTPTFNKLGDGNVSIRYKFDYETENNYSPIVPSDVGGYDIRIQVSESANYLAGTGYAHFTISKGTPVVSVTPASSLVYTGSALELISASSTTLGTIQYKLDSGEYSTNIPSATNAGTYTVYYKVVGNYNYNDYEETSVNVTIAKASIPDTIAPVLISKSSNSVTIQKFEPNPYGTTTYGMSTTNEPPSSPSGLTTYTGLEHNTTYYFFTLYVSANSNYKDTWSPALVVTTDKYNPDVIIDEASNLIYTGSPLKLLIKGVSSGGTIMFKIGTDGTYSTDIPSATNVGTYTVYYKVVGNEHYNDVAEASVEVSIAKANPTVTAPTAKTLTYTGSSQELVNAGTTTGGTLQYKLDSGTYSTDIPSAKNAGTYTVYYKVVGGDNYYDVAEASVNVKIVKADISFTPEPKCSSKTDTSITITWSEPSNGDETGKKYGMNTTNTTPSSWQDSKTFTGLTPNTTYYFFIKYIGDTNYNDTISSSTAITTNKTTPVVTSPTAKTLTYTGSSQELVNAGSTTGGTLQYKLDSGTYSTDIPSAKNAGTYTVYYKVVGNDTYADVAAASVSVTIDKAYQTSLSVPLVGITDTTITIDESAPNTVGNHICKYGVNTINEAPSTWQDTETFTGLTQDTTYYCFVKYIGDSNYYDTISPSKKVTTLKTPEVTAPTAKALTYTGSAQELVNAGSTVGGTLKYKLGTSGTYSTDIPSATDVGTYTVYYKVIGKSNYADVAEASISVTISKVTPVVTVPTAKTLTYTGESQELVNAGSTTGGTLQYKLDSGEYSTDIPSATNIGTYTVYYKVVGNDTYADVAETSISVTINKVTPVVTAPKAKSSSYTGTASEMISAGVTTGGTLVYALTTDTSAPSDESYSTTIPTATELGTYYIWYKVNGNDTYADVSASYVTAKISEGFDVTISSILQLVMDSSAGSHNQIKINYYNGTSEYLSISASTETDWYFYTSSSSRLSLPYTFNHVVSIHRESSFFTYYKGTESGISYTHDFGNGTLVLDSDITITRTGSAQCIDENSLITMADGSTKLMKDIEVGDMVLSVDFNTMQLVAREVIYTGSDEENYDDWVVDSYYLHTFSDGTQIKRAMRHRFYNLESGTFKHMDTWTADADLHAYKLDGTNPELVSTEIVQGQLHYARITVGGEGMNNYFANGLLTGDSEALPKGTSITLNEALTWATGTGSGN